MYNILPYIASRIPSLCNAYRYLAGAWRLDFTTASGIAYSHHCSDSRDRNFRQRALFFLREDDALPGHIFSIAIARQYFWLTQLEGAVCEAYPY